MTTCIKVPIRFIFISASEFISATSRNVSNTDSFYIVLMYVYLRKFVSKQVSFTLNKAHVFSFWHPLFLIHHRSSCRGTLSYISLLQIGENHMHSSSRFQHFSKIYLSAKLRWFCFFRA